MSNRVLETGGRGRWWLNWRTWGGIAALAAAILVVATLNQATPRLALFLIFGLAFGFVLQRSRFCFASAFRDLFLLRDGRVMKGILAGLAVATVGFAVIMYNLAPDLGLGELPAASYVVPLGFHLLLAGVIFGVGMVVAGGCIAGTFYRIGEGYVVFVVTLVGILAGMGLLLHNWNWWWQGYISALPEVWLPHSLGWVGAILLTLAVLLIVYLLIRRWESGGGGIARPVYSEPKAATPRDILGSLRRVVLGRAWPIIFAGIVLGALNTFEYLFAERPWGLTGEVSRWSGNLLNLVQLPPPEVIATPGACAIGGTATGVLLWGFMINGGIIFGAFIGALLSGEFKLRLPKQKRRYLQGFIGGALVGYGAGLAAGCTIGGFFSSVPSLGLNGFVFGGALAIGALLGVQVIKRIG
ncbi:MAG: YeeE/YedE family protein [Dehalococcoidales bacterium]